MTTDEDLRGMLEGTTAIDPTFRVQVIGRICARARRRVALRRAAVWVIAFALLGVLAKPLVPSETGAPGLEAVVMSLSLVATVLIASIGTNRLSQWLPRVL